MAALVPDDPFVIPLPCGDRCQIGANTALRHPDFVLTCTRPFRHEGRHGALAPAAEGRMVWLPWGEDRKAP